MDTTVDKVNESNQPLSDRVQQALAVTLRGCDELIPQTDWIRKLQKAEASGQPLIARRGFECQVELLHALRPYARFAEVPIRLAYDRKLGASKMRLLRTSWRTVSLGIHLMSRRGLGTKNG